MASLVWDEVGERIFQTGVDRGVLYLRDGTAVVWNGLTNVEESTSSEVRDFYLDGVIYLKSMSPRDFSAKLKALTYPDEFDSINGIAEASMGVVYYDQASQSFNLSYRTKIGNDIDGIDHGYKIHILYDIIANPDSYGFDGISDSAIQPIEFGWTLSGTPQKVKGFKPTVHVAVDSTEVPSSQLGAFEKILYGSDVKSPYLPSIEEISKLFGNLTPNPGFEIDKNDWEYALSDGATLLDFALSPKWSKFGAMSAHFKWQQPNDTTLRWGWVYTIVDNILPHVPYTASIHVKMIDPSASTADVLLYFSIEWYNEDGVQVGPSIYGDSLGGGAFWKGDFSSGDFSQYRFHQYSGLGHDTNQGYTINNVGNSDFSIVTSPAAPRNPVAGKYQVYSSGGGTSDNNRAENCTGQVQAGGFPGQEWYYGWWTMFPSGQSFWSGGGGWNVFTQFSGTDNNAWITFGIDATSGIPKLYVDVGFDPHRILVDLEFDHWYHFVVRVLWSIDSAVGIFQIWLDDVLVVNVNSATLRNQNSPAGQGETPPWTAPGNIMSQGFYSTRATDNTVYHAGLVRAATYDEAANFGQETAEGTRLTVTSISPQDAHSARLVLSGSTNVANDIIEYYVDGAQFEIGEEASSYIGVQLPVRNLFPNPSFGNDTTGWNRSVSSGATVDDFQVSDKWSKFGSRSLHFKWHGPNDSTTRTGQVYSTTGADGIPVLPGVPYTASIYLKTVDPSIDLGANSGFSLQIQWYDVTNAQIGSGPVSTLADEGTDGARMTVTGVAPDTAVAAAVYVSTTINDPNDVVEYYLDAAQFEIGSVASPFTDEVISTDNLIPNSSFEVNTSGWLTSVSADGTLIDFSTSTAWYKHGLRCAHFKWQNANNTTARSGVIYTPQSAAGIPVLPNTFYTFSIYVKVVDPSQPTGTTYGLHPQITWYDSDGIQIGSVVESSYSDESVNTNGARLLVGSCSPPDAAYASVSLSTSTNVANDTIEIYIDAAQFEIGPVASSYLKIVSPDEPEGPVLNAEFSMTML